MIRQAISPRLAIRMRLNMKAVRLPPDGPETLRHRSEKSIAGSLRVVHRRTSARAAARRERSLIEIKWPAKSDFR
jgi:hypothetical protein